MGSGADDFGIDGLWRLLCSSEWWRWRRRRHDDGPCLRRECKDRDDKYDLGLHDWHWNPHRSQWLAMDAELHSGSLSHLSE